MGLAAMIDSAESSVILCVARRSLIHAHHSTWEMAMRTLLVSMAFGLGSLLSQSVYAADAPAAAHTALCKDGTYFDGTSHKGACHGHQGVKEWLDGTAPKSDTTTKSDTAAATTTPASDDKSSKKSKKKKDTDTATTAASATPAPAAKPAAATPAAPAAAATTGAAAASTSTAHKTPTPASQITQKPGGGAGLVWVNSDSKVYHCPGDEWYGKTKEGSYMSAAAAEKAGAHPSHGTACK